MSQKELCNWPMESTFFRPQGFLTILRMGQSIPPLSCPVFSFTSFLSSKSMQRDYFNRPKGTKNLNPSWSKLHANGGIHYVFLVLCILPFWISMFLSIFLLWKISTNKTATVAVLHFFLGGVDPPKKASQGGPTWICIYLCQIKTTRCLNLPHLCAKLFWVRHQRVFIPGHQILLLGPMPLAGYAKVFLCWINTEIYSSVLTCDKVHRWGFCSISYFYVLHFVLLKFDTHCACWKIMPNQCIHKCDGKR